MKTKLTKADIVSDMIKALGGIRRGYSGSCPRCKHLMLDIGRSVKICRDCELEVKLPFYEYVSSPYGCIEIFHRIEFEKLTEERKHKTVWFMSKGELYITCPYCRRICGLDKSQIDGDGRTKYRDEAGERPGACFRCTHCFMIIQPWLMDWNDSLRREKER